MKYDEAFFLLQKFIFDFSGDVEFRKNDIVAWIDEQFSGVRPDKNKVWEIKGFLLSYSMLSRGDLFKLNVLKVEKYLHKYPEKLKEFKEKRKGK